MRKNQKQRPSSAFRRQFLSAERLEARLALATASPVAVNDFYHDLMDHPLTVNTPGILSNDTSPSGAALSAGLFSGPSHGTLELTDDGSFQYTPDDGFAGLDSFLYFANDGGSDSMLAAVTIDVGAGGPPPQATDDNFTVDEDGVLSVALSDGVLANDTAAEGLSLSVGLVAGPAHGTLSLGADGSFTYLPSANFNGTDAFTYKATDGAGDSALATATITVNAINDKPTAANDNFPLTEDSTLTVDVAGGLLANDADIDGDMLTPTITSQPLHGTLTMNADGSFTYTPASNYNGLDGFSYLVSDGTANSEVASATLLIRAVNDSPVSVNEEYSTAEDTPLAIAAPGVLANDTDVDGDALSSILVNPPEHGVVSLAADGSLLYTPNANFNGVDGFSYRANDGSADSEAAAVTINVTPVNDPPASSSDQYQTNEDTPLTIASAGGALANDSDADGDPLSATLLSGPSNGTLTMNADGSFNYVPNANFNGSDSFVYQASDGQATGDPTTVTIAICPVNDAPVAVADAYSLDEDKLLTIDAATGVLANDSDIDGDTPTATVVTGPANGSLSMNADGSFTYTPRANFNGSDSFVYQAADGSTATPATVSLTVNSVADAPIPAIDNYSTGEDVPLVVDASLGVLANDLNPEGGAITAEVVTGPANGSLSLNADGSFNYTPAANFHGTDTFTYKAVSNGQEIVSSANIVVEPLNDPPIAMGDAFTVDPTMSATATGNVLANDSDIDGDLLAASLVDGPAHGTLSLNQDGTFTYTPQSGFTGDDAFRYQAFDGKANSNVAIAQLHVTSGTSEAPPPVETPPPAENQRPVATNDVFTMPGNTTLNIPAVSGLLLNDSDPEGAALTASLFSHPLHGSVALAADGSFSYTPTTGYTGMDAFLYRVSDGARWSPLAAVTIHVTPADGPDEAPTPDPEPCGSHQGDQATEHLVSRLAHARQEKHQAKAVDAIFGRPHWWLA